MSLYALGSNGSGQLGMGHRLDVAVPTACKYQESSPVPVTQLKRIVAGGNDTFLLFSDGSVKLAGASAPTWNAPALESKADVYMALSLQEPVKLCSATWDAFIAVTPSGRIYTVGTGTKGELGRGPGLTAISNSHALEPLNFSRLMPDGAVVVDLASGLNHTVVVLSDGQVLGWGQGRKGQLGEPPELVWEPRRLEGIGFPVVRAVCGREFTYLVGSPDLGQHAILGPDKWNLKADAPPMVPGWKDVGASWTGIFVLDSASCLISWGRNDHGQLAPSGLPPIHKMAIGSEHALVLTTAGQVLAWGWGEHGNCGEEVDEDGDVKHRWAEIPLPLPESCRVLDVGAGCATSWMWIRDHRS